MGHYDSCREGYCAKCGAAPGNHISGKCQFCHPATLPAAPAPTEQAKLHSAIMEVLVGRASGIGEDYLFFKRAPTDDKRPVSMIVDEIVAALAARQAPTGKPIGYIDQRQLEWLGELSGRTDWNMATVQLWPDGKVTDGVPMFVGQAPDAGKDAQRFASAIARDDNAEALYAAVMSHSPDADAILRAERQFIMPPEPAQ